MNAGPYSDEKVRKFIEEEYVPLKSECFWKERTELMKRFNIAWTPTFLFQDSGGKVHGKLVGYMPEDDFLAQLKFGKGIVFFEKERHEEAAKWFSKVIEEHPNAGTTPEAIFFLGVAEYKKTHEAGALRRVYDALAEKYPQSEWARRARPYSAIPK
jgi:thioredoxin-related protein